MKNLFENWNKYLDEIDDPDSDKDDADEIRSLEDVGARGRIEEMVDDHNFSYADIGETDFFRTLVRETGKYLSPREDELVTQLHDAVVNILVDAAKNKYTAGFPSFKEE